VISALRTTNAISPQDYARSIAACQDSIHSLEGTIAQLQTRARDLDTEAYDHTTMLEACAHDLSHAQTSARSAAMTMGVGGGVALMAGVACIASGSIWLGLLAAASALVAGSAVRTRAAAVAAQPRIRSYQDAVRGNAAATERKRSAVYQKLGQDQSLLTAQRAQLELLQVASRVSAPRSEDQTITQSDDAVKIGSVSVRKRDASKPQQ